MEFPIISFEHFGFQYHAQAEPTLYDISFSVKKGEKVLIAGPSGCGKSTIAHCINGLIPFAYKGDCTGSLKIKGTETSELSIFDISKIVGTVLQDSDSQFVGMTVAEDISFALENDCIPTEEMKQLVKKTAQHVGIDSHLTHAPTDLSGGQKQRVSLAGVMVDDVELLLFDEPLANLDPFTGKQAIELIDEIQKETGAAVIIIEHRLEDVLRKSVDRIILMNNGRILTDCPPDVLLSGSMLIENGIREPLYLTALKYAGVDITPEMHPWNINELVLNDDDTEKVRKWFLNPIDASREPQNDMLMECRHIDFKYENGYHALKDISLSVRKGEILAIVGSNGAGKSTFSKVICGFETQQKGTVSFENTDMSRLSIKERAEYVGYVMQNPNQMISKIMIRDEIALGLQTRNIPEDEISSLTDETLKICGLYPFRNWPVSALSYGQKKRVTIASILVLKPKLIILDEPTAGQDYRHYTEIMEFIKDLNTAGITVAMITHDMHLMLEYADRAVVFHNGSIVAIDTGANILTNEAVVKQASLKETSLYYLAKKCGIENAGAFVQHFIDVERKRRKKHD